MQNCLRSTTGRLEVQRTFGGITKRRKTSGGSLCRDENLIFYVTEAAPMFPVVIRKKKSSDEVKLTSPGNLIRGQSNVHLS